MKLLQFAHQIAGRLFYSALIASVASGLTNAALAGLISQHLVQHDTVSNRLMGSFALLILLAVICDFAAKQTLSALVNTVFYELRLSFASQVLTTAFPRLERIGNPRLFALLTDDIDTIGQVVLELPTLCIGLATILGGLIYLAWLAPVTLLAVALLALPLLGGYWWLQRRTSRLYQQILVLRNQLHATYRDLTDGIKELKLQLSRLAAFYHAHLQPLVVENRIIFAQYYWYHAVAQSVNQFTYFLLILGLFALSRWVQMPLEVFGAYAVMLLYLKSATVTLISSLPHWIEARITIAQIEALGFTLRAPTVIAQVTDGTSPAPAPLQIALQGLTYEYQHTAEEGSFQLGPLDCTLHSGEIVFIIGGNGSGKTTFLKLLVGLYTPDAGTIICNGRAVTPESSETYRRNFAVLFAEPYLFTQLLGLPWDNLDQRARAWLQRLQIAHKVQVVDGRLSTLNLSFGQRKRLALLNAYLEERPIYLFDEWAAGQDPEFRELFYRTLLPELKAQGKLVIVISHDDHYFDAADRIIKFDGGVIEYDSAAHRRNGHPSLEMVQSHVV